MYTEEEQRLLEEWVASQGIDCEDERSLTVCLVLKDGFATFGTWSATLKPSVSIDKEEGVFFATREALKHVKTYLGEQFN